MKWSLRLGRFLGIDVFLHVTFLILVAIVWYTTRGEGLGKVLFMLCMFTCVVLHEYGHALMARRFGVATRDITLLPIQRDWYHGSSYFFGKVIPTRDGKGRISGLRVSTQGASNILFKRVIVDRAVVIDAIILIIAQKAIFVNKSLIKRVQIIV
jgi:Zn-dependent protease